MCDPENPTIFEDFLRALGPDVLDFPSRIDCCGSYLSIAKPDAALRASHKILDSAHKTGADAVVVTCPLCFYNLDSLQARMQDQYPEFRTIPILYFTQLLAYSLGAPIDKLKVDPLPLLERVFGSVPGEVTA